MENHHAIHGKTHYFYGHFPVRKLLNYQRVPPINRFQSQSAVFQASGSMGSMGPTQRRPEKGRPSESKAGRFKNVAGLCMGISVILRDFMAISMGFHNSWWDFHGFNGIYNRILIEFLGFNGSLVIGFWMVLKWYFKESYFFPDVDGIYPTEMGILLEITIWSSPMEVDDFSQRSEPPFSSWIRIFKCLPFLMTRGSWHKSHGKSHANPHIMVDNGLICFFPSSFWRPFFSDWL